MAEIPIVDIIYIVISMKIISIIVMHMEPQQATYR